MARRKSNPISNTTWLLVGGGVLVVGGVAFWAMTRRTTPPPGGPRNFTQSTGGGCDPGYVLGPDGNCWAPCQNGSAPDANGCCPEDYQNGNCGGGGGGGGGGQVYDDNTVVGTDVNGNNVTRWQACQWAVQYATNSIAGNTSDNLNKAGLLAGACQAFQGTFNAPFGVSLQIQTPPIGVLQSNLPTAP